MRADGRPVRSDFPATWEECVTTINSWLVNPAQDVTKLMLDAEKEEQEERRRLTPPTGDGAGGIEAREAPGRGRPRRGRLRKPLIFMNSGNGQLISFL